MTTGKRGRPRKYATPDDLEKAVNRYFASCDEEERFPSLPGMLLFLGMSKQTYYKYIGDTEHVSEAEDDKRFPKWGRVEAKMYRDIFERAALIREDWLAAKMANDGKGANGYMNLLKQKENGAYKDRPENDESKSITINLIGVGGETNFK